ncbi:hypothetical protein [Streptomyces sp. MK5]|uniref:hypothetical protein n=1 Tax=Streptomyces sp. MK5 TaxID=3064253 RepID=UPI0027423DF8|nr:hypothetical protein [Streptomyces sp. MK5]
MSAQHIVGVIVAVGLVGYLVLEPDAVALSAAAWSDPFLTRPYERFTMTNTDDVETAVPLPAVGLIVSQPAARARRLEVVTGTDARTPSLSSTRRPTSPGPPRRPASSSNTSGSS